MTKRPLKLFLGSSTAARSLAKRVASGLSSESVTFLPWWETFTAGRTLLSELDEIRNKVDGAVLLVTPDVPTLIRGRAVSAPNLNVLFEFGYFYGHFGKSRVALIRYGDVHLPNDLGGYIHVHGSNVFRSAGSTRLNTRTQTEFSRWLHSFPMTGLSISGFESEAEAEVPPLELSEPLIPNGKRKFSGKADEFMALMSPSPALGAIVGNRPMQRTEIVLRTWNYIKKHGLQDPVKKSLINTDKKLRHVCLGKDQISMFELAGHINEHLSPSTVF